MEENRRIIYLLDKYLNKKHSHAEAEELFKYLKNIKDPELLEDVFQRGWKVSGQIDRSDILSWEQFLKDQGSKVLPKSRVNSRIISLRKWAVAASVLILIGMIWWINSVRNDAIIVYQTGFGETKEIILNDGTEVILNANSSLVWNSDWKKHSSREVKLMGEAYFDVSHLDKYGESAADIEDGEPQLIPFKVETNDLSVNVLGTAFNVMSRRGKTDVFLERGKVRLDLANTISKENNNEAQNNLALSEKTIEVVDVLYMKPGDVVSFSAEAQDLELKEASNPHTYAEWKEGTLSFENVEFGIMLNQLEDIYGKTFITNDSTLLNTPVRFAFPYENWETVTKLMEVSLNIKLIEEENNKVRMEKRME